MSTTTTSSKQGTIVSFTWPIRPMHDDIMSVKFEEAAPADDAPATAAADDAPAPKGKRKARKAA